MNNPQLKKKLKLIMNQNNANSLILIMNSISYLFIFTQFIITRKVNVRTWENKKISMFFRHVGHRIFCYLGVNFVTTK